MNKQLHLYHVSQQGKKESVFYAVVVREGSPAVTQFSSKGFKWFFANETPEEISPEEFMSKLREFGESNEKRLAAIGNFLSLKFHTVLPR